MWTQHASHHLFETDTLGWYLAFHLYVFETCCVSLWAKLSSKWMQRNVKQDAFTREGASEWVSVRACVAAQQESSSSGHSYLWSPSSPTETLSLRGRLAHSRRTGDGLVKEGETAGVKATLWPEVKSGESGPTGISESRSLSSNQLEATRPRFHSRNCFCRKTNCMTGRLCANTYVPRKCRACTHYALATASRRLHLHTCGMPPPSGPHEECRPAMCVRGLQRSHKMYIWATEEVCDAAHVLVISANTSE